MLNKLMFSILLIVAIVINLPLSAQTVKARVALQSDRLLPEERNILSDIPNRLEDYINSYDWAGDNEQIEIDLRLNFVIEAVSDRGSEQIFRGQIVTNSSSGENFVDRAVEFVYQQGQSMQHDEALFNSLTSIVDYYIYMIMGGEMDAYLIKGGTFFYDRARIIAEQGLISNYKLGWTARQEEVNSVTDADHAFLREAKFYYYEGLFFIESRRDREKGPLYSKKVVDLLENIQRRKPSSKILKRFLDAHNQEFCKLFSYDTTEENARRMMGIDNRRREVYEACLTAREQGEYN
ncbi:MAG: DUF4835 family protein [Calditrichia bacterium]